VTSLTVPVSIVICTYSQERWNDLGAALDSLLGGSARPSEIIVVVDHDPTLEQRVRSAYPQVKTIPNQGLRGLSAARNSGVEAAHGEIVAFLDDDVIVEPDWLARLVAGYADRNVLGVGGSAAPRWPAERPRWFPTEFDWVIGCSHRGLPTDVAPVRNMIGCNMSFRRRLFGQIEGFKSQIGRVGRRGNRVLHKGCARQSRRPVRLRSIHCRASQGDAGKSDMALLHQPLLVGGPLEGARGGACRLRERP